MAEHLVEEEEDFLVDVGVVVETVVALVVAVADVDLLKKALQLK